jgi:hypothetical protein
MARTLSALLLALAVAADPLPARATSITVAGITFSDEAGGVVLEKVTGQGSMDDPFVITERLTDINGGVLTFRVDPNYGNRIGSVHAIGFALMKVVQNATNLAWSNFEIELQSKFGIPSDYSDGLSFGQGSEVGRPFTASGFAQVTIVDEPTDSVQFNNGRVPIGGRTILRFVITESQPLTVAYLVQRPVKPLADAQPRRLRPVKRT